MEIWTKNYSAHDVARVTGVAPATLQNWLKRGVVVGYDSEDIEGGGVQGKHRRFSFHAVMQIGMASALIKAGGGMDIKAAFNAAMHFAHIGEGPSGYVGSGSFTDDGERRRDPGFPYHYSYGRTLLATANGNTAIVLNKASEDSFWAIYRKLQRAEGFTVVDAGAIFDRICSGFGVHPNEILDAAYPEAMAA